MTESAVGGRVGPILAELLDLVLPVDCTGCGRPGSTVCAACRSMLRPAVRERTAPGGLRIWSGLDYEGPARSILLAFKNGGRTDHGRLLATSLAAAVGAALSGMPIEGVDLVPMPRTRRSAIERGYDPTRVLLRRARLPARPLLRLAARRADQAALDRSGRFANAANAMTARAAPGARVLLVDDVVTTGATLLEAERAVTAAGAEVLGAVTVASTPLRHGPPVAGNSDEGAGDKAAAAAYRLTTASQDRPDRHPSARRTSGTSRAGDAP